MIRLIVPVFILLLIVSCSTTIVDETKYGDDLNIIDDSADQEPDEIIPDIDETLSENQPVTEDSDGDGEDDTISYSYDIQEIAPDLFMKKKITLNHDEDTFDGEIILEFSGDGVGEHIEIIPKSLASSVSDLEFSVEPDEIIDDDPVVKWIMDKSKERIKKITISIRGKAIEEASGDAISAGVISLFSEAGNVVSGKKFNLGNVIKSAKKAGADKGKKVAMEKLWDHMEDVLFLSDLQVCQNKKDGSESGCILALVAKHPEWFKYEECSNIFSDENDEKLKNICRAVIKEDGKECDRMSKSANEFCHAYSFTYLTRMRCSNIADVEKRVKCFYDYSVKMKWSQGCAYVQDPVIEKLCYTETTQKWDRCKDIDYDFIKVCCDKIIDERENALCIKALMDEEDIDRHTVKIRVDPDDDILETGKKYTFFMAGAREEGIFEFDFGDGKPVLKSMKPYYTYTYFNKSKFIVIGKQIINEKVVTTATKEYSTGYPYYPLELIQNTTQLSVSVCGDAFQKDKKGGENELKGLCNTIYYVDSDVVWDGTSFKIDYDKEDGENHIVIKVNGEINADATKLISLAGEFTSVHKGTDTRKVELSVSNIDLTIKNNRMPVVREHEYNPKFTGYLEGAKVSSHISKNKFERTYNYLGDPDFKLWHERFNYPENSNSRILVVFKDSRISAYDDPGFGKR